MQIALRIVLLLALILAPAARAQDPRIDPDTGADLAHYPPPRHFDHLHMSLAIDIPDMGVPKITAVERLTVAAIGRARKELVLDAGPDLSISGVQLESGAKPSAAGSATPLAFTHANDKLTIAFPKPLPPGQQATFVISYSGEFPHANGKGLTWTQGTADAQSPTNQAAQIHSQGQPDQNHTWFPCHDFPNERLTTELVVTVDDAYVVASNGRLDSKVLGSPSPSGTPRSTWHWVQDRPHANYLVSLVVGKFAIVGLSPTGPTPLNMNAQPVRCYLYTPFGTEQNAAKVFARTPDMVYFFSEYFGHPYPWDKYSQALVRRFAAGGMENTSATTLGTRPATAKPGTQDDLISHELAHQWTGDLLTCKSWEHIWLNEGWANYAEALWAEHDAGDNPAARKKAYLGVIRRFLGMQRALNRTYAPAFPPMASNLYNAPDDAFIRPNDPYSKGGLVLHMLRVRLGDELFQRAVQTYINRFAFKEVETDDFRQTLEEVSAQSLEQFFDQWVTRPGLPRIEADLAWADAPSPGPREGGGTLTVTIEQTQRIDAKNPAYVFELPIEVEDADGDRRTVRMAIDARSQSASFDLAHRPRNVRLDPDLNVACARNVRTSLEDSLGTKKGNDPQPTSAPQEQAEPDHADQKPQP